MEELLSEIIGTERAVRITFSERLGDLRKVRSAVQLARSTLTGWTDY